MTAATGCLECSGSTSCPWNVQRRKSGLNRERNHLAGGKNGRLFHILENPEEVESQLYSVGKRQGVYGRVTEGQRDHTAHSHTLGASLCPCVFVYGIFPDALPPGY